MRIFLPGDPLTTGTSPRWAVSNNFRSKSVLRIQMGKEDFPNRSDSLSSPYAIECNKGCEHTLFVS